MSHGLLCDRTTSHVTSDIGSPPNTTPGQFQCDKVRQHHLQGEPMKRSWIIPFCSVPFLAGSFAISAQAQPAEAQKHVAAARALAYEPGFDYTFSFETICAEPKPAGARGGRGGGGQRGPG